MLASMFTIAGGIVLGALCLCVIAAIAFFIFATGADGARFVFGVVFYGAIAATVTFMVVASDGWVGAVALWLILGLPFAVVAALKFIHRNWRDGFVRKLFWMAFQAAIVGGVLFLFYGTPEGQREDFGLAPWLIAIGLAWLATIIPVAIVEGLKDVRRIYLPAFRRWRARRGLRIVAPGSETDELPDDLRNPRLVGLGRKLPE
jgi:hypothetical protein